MACTLLAISCHEASYVQAVYQIEIPKTQKRVVLQDLFTDFRIVALENDEQCMLSRVKHGQPLLCS